MPAFWIQVPGRGPGSGVRATPKSLALLAIAVVAGGSLSEIENHVRTLANIKSSTKHCPLTGKATFASALTAVLADETLAQRVRWIRIERGSSSFEAQIVYDVNLEARDHSKRLPSSHFGVKWSASSGALRVGASMFLPWASLARALKENSK